MACHSASVRAAEVGACCMHPTPPSGRRYSNIVAACLRCNRGRHRRREAPDPVLFRAHVQRRLAAGRWR